MRLYHGSIEVVKYPEIRQQEANDRVYAQFALFEAGLIDKQTLIRELKTYTLVDQLLFHTPEALKSITFVESRRIAL